MYNIKTGTTLENGSDIIAISAIGQPEQFYKFLSNYNIKQTLSFDDHHSYTESEIPTGTVVTTEKDAVKMQNFNREDIYALKLKTEIDVTSVLSD